MHRTFLVQAIPSYFRTTFESLVLNTGKKHSIADGLSVGKKANKMKTSVKILRFSVENVIFSRFLSSSICCKMNCFNKVTSFQNSDSTGKLIFYLKKVLMRNFKPVLK